MYRMIVVLSSSCSSYSHLFWLIVMQGICFFHRIFMIITSIFGQICRQQNHLHYRIALSLTCNLTMRVYLVSVMEFISYFSRYRYICETIKMHFVYSKTKMFCASENMQRSCLFFQLFSTNVLLLRIECDNVEKKSYIFRILPVYCLICVFVIVFDTR